LELFESFRDYGWYLGTFGFFVASGLIPVLNCELYLLWLAVTAPPEHLVPLLVVGTIGQMLAKCVLFWVGRGAVNLPFVKGGEKLESLRQRMATARAAHASVTFASATLGLPPFYWFSLAAGALGWAFAPFLLIGFVGRLLRFGLVLFVPQGLASFVHVDVGPVGWSVAAATGILAGLHVSTWDVDTARAPDASLFRRHWPGIAVGAAVAVAWEAILGLDLAHPKARLLLLGLTYAFASGLTRLYRIVKSRGDSSTYKMAPAALAWGLVVALAWSVLMTTLTDQYLLVALSSIGYAIATLETRGTFVRSRYRFAPLSVAIGVVVLGHVALGFGQPAPVITWM
jgi:membrane protein YqaA with SNARE-associated domain